MNKRQKKWVKRQLTYAIVFFIIGVLALSIGAVIEIANKDIGVDDRLITASGILFLGISLSSWLRYFAGRKDNGAAARLINDETDERLLLMRAHAGKRGFWYSISITYLLLLWESFSSNGQLPALSDDARWYWLAWAVVVPLIVYISSILYDQAHS